jgi:hypothetical protein
MPPNYANGKIYTVRSRSRPDLVYVGSTTQTLSVRFGSHKVPSNHCSSRQITELGDSYIELYENYACTGKDELNRREGEVMRSMECVNSRIAGRTSQQYYQDNTVAIAAKVKQYRLDNVVAIAVQKKQYYLDNRAAIAANTKQWYLDNAVAIAVQQKQYKLDNRVEIAAKGKQYYQDNTVAIAAKVKQYNLDNAVAIAVQKKQYYQSKKNIQMCVCGAKYNYGKKFTRDIHYRSKKHQNHIQLIHAKLRGE